MMKQQTPKTYTANANMHKHPKHNILRQKVKRCRISRRENTIRRNTALRKRFDVLYSKKRLRFDDVIEQLCIEFYMTDRVVRRILTKPDDPL